MNKKTLLLAVALFATALSASAQYYLIVPDLPVPKPLAASGISEYGFDANWETVDPNAEVSVGGSPLGYYLRGYVSMTATQDNQRFYYLNTDFSDLTGSSGTFENPDNPISQSSSFITRELPGKTRRWYTINQAFVDGVLCLNGAFAYTAATPALYTMTNDFSKGGGIVHVSFKIKGDGKVSKFAVNMRNTGRFPNRNIDSKKIDVTTEWTEYEFTLSGGLEKSDIMFTGDEAGTGENMYYFLDDVKVWQELKTGETVRALFYDKMLKNEGITATTAYVDTYELNPGEDDGFTISSYNGRGISNESELVTLHRDNPYVTGITTPTVGKQQDGCIYDLSGRRVTGTVQRGIYIKDGKKFVVR